MCLCSDWCAAAVVYVNDSKQRLALLLCRTRSAMLCEMLFREVKPAR